jgi:hypothetical protein
MSMATMAAVTIVPEMGMAWGLVDDLIKAAEAVRGALRAADLPPEL